MLPKVTLTLTAAPFHRHARYTNPPQSSAAGWHQAMSLNHGISIRECVNLFEYVGIATAVVKPVLVVVVAPNANYFADWTRSGTGPVDRSHHSANRNGSGTVPLRSHREVVGSYRNEWTQWNRSEHGQLERFRNGSSPKPVVWTRLNVPQKLILSGPNIHRPRP